MTLDEAKHHPLWEAFDARHSPPIALAKQWWEGDGHGGADELFDEFIAGYVQGRKHANGCVNESVIAHCKCGNSFDRKSFRKYCPNCLGATADCW